VGGSGRPHYSDGEMKMDGMLAPMQGLIKVMWVILGSCIVVAGGYFGTLYLGRMRGE
jgi:hypothetical protein